MRWLSYWLRRYLRDSIVIRVSVFIYGAMLLGVGLALANAFIQPESFEWVAVMFGLTILGFGAFMTYASVFGRLRFLEKAADAVSGGGELLGIVLVLVVFIVAIPIAAVVKRIRSLRQHF
jgi:hypothetical protein